MSALHPHAKDLILTPEQVSEVNVIRLASRLHKLPHEIRNAPATDIYSMIDVLNADEEIQKVKAQKNKPHRKPGKKRR
jgi:hypothetical protein